MDIDNSDGSNHEEIDLPGAMSENNCLQANEIHQNDDIENVHEDIITKLIKHSFPMHNLFQEVLWR